MDTNTADGSRGVAIYAINSNNVNTYTAARPRDMKEEATALGYTFPYVHDESQPVTKVYSAACTPDFYLFDAEQKPSIGCSIKWRAGNEPEYL
jgi:hypothetical protein